MVHFSTSPKQCFCTTLQNIHTKIASFHSMSYDYFIENFKNTLCMDCLSIVSFHYWNSIQQVFEMSSLHANTRLQTLSPLADSSVCTTCRSTMSTNSSGDWLTFGAVCSKVLLTLLSASGESICRRVFARRRTFRTPAVCCFDTGMKLSIDCPCTTCLLSLIHIWRCRRIERCRSRWSPYH